jgi:ribosomal protein L7/L12
MIGAIKVYKDEMGVSLMTAKEAVEAAAAQQQ